MTRIRKCLVFGDRCRTIARANLVRPSVCRFVRKILKLYLFPLRNSFISFVAFVIHLILGRVWRCLRSCCWTPTGPSTLPTGCGSLPPLSSTSSSGISARTSLQIPLFRYPLSIGIIYFNLLLRLII